MNHLEQQKERLVELIDLVDLTPREKLTLSSDIDTLIEATHQAAIEECVRVIEDITAPTGEWREALEGFKKVLISTLTTLKADK